MKLTPVAFDSKLATYQKQAEELLAAWRRWDGEAVQIIRQHHRPFLDQKVNMLVSSCHPANAGRTEVAAYLRELEEESSTRDGNHA